MLLALFITMTPSSRTRAAQFTKSGLGAQFVGPRKQQDKRKLKPSLLAGKSSSEETHREFDPPPNAPFLDEQMSANAFEDSNFFEGEVSSPTEQFFQDLPSS
ncbi:hypothetical protein K503DRAFT_867341 [Rhizopogon vinicolor AM-OR11-026]|uniref:AGC-kinase C-terminal domain-containing protein n=1 Tax=Rhizopogon vinicolor AM-OR11-026 TaxID=1314800 RepID=A0A1B7MVX4_9AGAM|nr:hypothetical protein K503DRAFT_867341 [Rhizopogon vinicolor AM-OR11-026]